MVRTTSQPAAPAAALVQRRTTKQRQLVLNIVRSQHTHPTADEVFALAREANPHISRATVYRNLSLLTQEGSLLSVTVGGVSRYDDATHPHAHLVCTACGRVDDVPLEHGVLDGCIDRAQDTSGYQVSHSQLMLYGTCPECRKAAGGLSARTA